MTKKKLAMTLQGMALATVTLTSFTLAANPRVVPNPPPVAADAYILVDHATGAVLVEKNADEQLPPASLTKMMTSYVIGKEIQAGNISMDDQVTISRNAWAKNFPDSSKMFIEVGKTVTFSDLNRGIVVQSGNDASVAAAEHIAGSEDAFASLMNSWASKLGMDNTYFENSHGLHSDTHYTTARDMATLGSALIRDVPEEYALYEEKSFTFNGIKQYNRNSLLWDKSMKVDGIKTGHTSKAGYSLVSSATRDEMRLVAVVMGAKSVEARTAESKKLLNFGFRFFQTVTPYDAGTTLVNERIWMGEQSEVALGVANATSLTIPRGQARNLEAQFALDGDLTAPIAKGTKVGSVFFELAGEELAQYDLVALETVEEAGWFSRLIDYLHLMIKSWFK